MLTAVRKVVTYFALDSRLHLVSSLSFLPARVRPPRSLRLHAREHANQSGGRFYLIGTHSPELDSFTVSLTSRLPSIVRATASTFSLPWSPVLLCCTDTSGSRDVFPLPWEGFTNV